MDKNNKSMFSKLKSYYDKKPVRIIIALIVIAGIMVGVSFGIMALVKSLSDPCTQQPGKVWNKELKKCVPETCPNNGPVCTIPGKTESGNCIPKDYCKNIDGQQYIYDKNTCECTISCSEGQPYSEDGNSTTKFDNEGNPVNPLQCGRPCEFNTKPTPGIGGNKWCPVDGYICGQSIFDPNINVDKGKGCYNTLKYKSCGYDSQIDTTIVCDNDIPCTSNSEGQPRCTPSKCEGSTSEGEELVYACLEDEDCGAGGKCITGISVKSSDDPHIEKFKYFKKVGYCDKTNNYNDSRCSTKRLIGEISTSTTDDTPVIKICKNINSTVEGISTLNPQCDGVGENGCAEFGICDNDWQGKSDPTQKNCIDPKESIEEARKEMEYYCCDNPAVTPSGDKFCCPGKTFSDPEFGNQLCTLNTKFGYSKKHLDSKASLNEIITCSVDEDCTSYNEDFYNALHITKSEGEDKTKNKFSSLYCDKTNKVCKAYCGFYDGTSELKDNFGKIDISIESSKKEYSYCFPKDSCKIAWKKTTSGRYLPNGYPVCEKTEGQTSTYKWSGNYGDGYTFKSENNLIDCSDQEASINTCMNALGKSNYHIDDVYVDKGKCGFSTACDQLELTTDKGTVSWTSLKEPSWANNNKIEFTGSGKEPGIGLIAQTANPKNTQTGIQNYATVSNSNCIGITNSFSEDITINPFSYISHVKSCDLQPTGKLSKLSHTGEYCINGVDPLNTSGACLKNPLDCGNPKKENFGNIDVKKNNKKKTLSTPPIPPPANNIFGLVDKEKNNQATIQDSLSNKFSCGDLRLNNDGVHSKNLQTELTDNPVKITCTDDECGNGEIKCIYGQQGTGQPTDCCGTADPDNPYYINFDASNNVYSCIGGMGVGYKPDHSNYNCVITQDGWRYRNTEDGKMECMKTDIQPGGYYCKYPGKPGTIMNPYGSSNEGKLNMNISSYEVYEGHQETGMVGITGCRWEKNWSADFGVDDCHVVHSWSDVELTTCTLNCSSYMEGKREKTTLKEEINNNKRAGASGAVVANISGLTCEYHPKGEGKGQCNIWNFPKGGTVCNEIINNSAQGGWTTGKLMTKCNDIFPSSVDENGNHLSGLNCGFEPCAGVAGPGYVDLYNKPGASGTAGNCIEDGGSASGCLMKDGGSIHDNPDCTESYAGPENCCGTGCGYTPVQGAFPVGIEGGSCDKYPPCCGTGWGKDGVKVKGGWSVSYKCIDNNTYPCTWGPGQSPREEDVKLWSAANTEIKYDTTSTSAPLTSELKTESPPLFTEYEKRKNLWTKPNSEIK